MNELWLFCLVKTHYNPSEIKTIWTRLFETRGPVDPARNYVVSRQAEIAELIERIKQGRYIVIFAPRQTGKTTYNKNVIRRFSTDLYSQ